jgi:hypothetical protein
MSWRPFALLAIAGLTARGAHMMARPQSYVGPRWHEARDPRVVRQFGSFHLVAGTLVFAMILVQFVSE